MLRIDDQRFCLILTKAVQIGLLLLCLTPLLFYRPFIHYYASTKAFFLFAVIEITVFLLIWLFALRYERLSRLKPIGIAFFVFVFFLTLTTIFGIDPMTSFWSTPTRMTGLLLYIHLAGMFWAIITVFKTTRAWKLFFLTHILTGLIISLLYFFPFLAGKNLLEANGGSTLGNSSVFGTYLLFLIGFSIILFTWKPSGKRIKFFGLASALVFVITLFFTDANAAQISLLLGFIILIALFAVKRTSHRLRAWIGGASVALLTIGLLAVGVLLFVPNTTVHDTFVSIGGPTRLIIWDIAWQGIKERPLLGWGLEQFSNVFLRYYNPCLGSAECGSGAWVDRAHNIILDTTISSGIVGLLAYLGIFVVAIMTLWKKYTSHSDQQMVTVTIAILLAAYFVQNLTGIDSVVSLFLWVMILAFCNWFTINDEQKKYPPIRNHAATILISGILLTLGITFFVVRPAAGFLGPSASRQATSVEKRLASYNSAVNLSPAGRDYRRSFMAFKTSEALWYASTQTLGFSASASRQELNIAQIALMDTLTHTPNYLRAHLMLSRLYQVESRLSRPSAIDDARDTLVKAIEFNQRNPQPLWALTSVLLEKGDIDEALVVMNRAFDLNPDDPKAHIARTAATVFTGDKKQIKNIADESSALYPHLSETLQSIAGANPTIHRLQLLTVFY